MVGAAGRLGVAWVGAGGGLWVGAAAKVVGGVWLGATRRLGVVSAVLTFSSTAAPQSTIFHSASSQVCPS